MLASLLPKFEENGLYALVLLARSVIKGADVHSRVSASTQSLNQAHGSRRQATSDGNVSPGFHTLRELQSTIPDRQSASQKSC
jgi:hypothetical protein